ncbi:MAG: MAPEG family protein [Pseudomonadota bacterium]
MVLPITLTIAAVAALLNIWLALRVVRLRMTRKVLLGDGGERALEARIRAHANYIEYTPFVLILIGLIEAAHGWPLGLWGVGALYVAARVAHAFGMDATRPHAARAFGATVTWLTLLGLAGWAIAIVYRAA